jgi:hypothetical protein
VKRFFHLALLIGALFGLFGQGVAMAMSPHCAAVIAQSAKAQTAANMPMSGAMDCCPDATPGKNGSKPAKDMMPDCPLMAGCFVSLTLDEAVVLSPIESIKPAAAVWSPVTLLVGRSTAPDLPPPTI